MNIKIKWLIHEYYFAIAIITLAVVGIVAPILYLQGADWKILLTIIGGLFSFFYFVQKQQLDEAKFINELIVKFNNRYDGMNERLNGILEKCAKENKLDHDDFDSLYDYFNLCGEEYLFYRRGYIYPEVWKSWVAGMNIYYENECVQELWSKELRSQSYYSLDVCKEIMECLDITKHNNVIQPTAK